MDSCQKTNPAKLCWKITTYLPIQRHGLFKTHQTNSMQRERPIGWCVGVCVRSHLFSDSPTDQGETCSSLCSVFRGLHFAAYFSVLLHQPGLHTGGGEHWGFFPSFYFFQCTHSCGIFCLQLSLSLVDNTMSDFVYSRSFSAHRFPGTKVRKKTLSPRSEPVTWSLDATGW